VWRFAVKRLLRIWPGLAVAILLTALVLGPAVSTLTVREYFEDPLLGSYARNLMFDFRDQLPLAFTGNDRPTLINGSLWTIPLELQCYVALGILGLLGCLRLRWLLPSLSVGAALLVYLVVAPIYFQTPERIPLRADQAYLLHFGLFFFAGASLNQLRLADHPRHALAVLIGFYLLGALAFVVGTPLLALWLVLPVSVVLAGQAGTPVLRRAGRFGDLSYGLYIYAFPVQQTLIWQLKDQLSWGALLALTIATTTVLAFASWHLVEKRALRLKPGRSND
jgi:peptidoglycan/LPS O-acetylase OafA/YrhL